MTNDVAVFWYKTLPKLSIMDMADIIMSIWFEMKRRNPIGINMYYPDITLAASTLKEIHYAELENPTCED